MNHHEIPMPDQNISGLTFVKKYRNDLIMKSLIWLTSLVVLSVLVSCKHDPDPITPNPNPDPTVCDTTQVTYPGTVVPILEAYCFGCHSGATPSAALDLTDYSRLAFVAQNGSLLGSITHASGYAPMPQNAPKMSDCNIRLITKWVNDTTFNIDPNPVPSCDPDTVFFQNEILPLLVSSCGVIGCHDPGTAEDGIVMTDYASIISAGIIRPGNPTDSELYEVITESDPEDRMPPIPKEPLNSIQIAKIEKWIRQGARNNVCYDDQCDTIDVTFSGQIWPVIQNSCLGCHSGSNASAGLLLTNHSEIASASVSGNLMASISHTTGFSPMPKNGNKLSDCTISQFNKWIENGTPNN